MVASNTPGCRARVALDQRQAMMEKRMDMMQMMMEQMMQHDQMMESRPGQ